MRICIAGGRDLEDPGGRYLTVLSALIEKLKAAYVLSGGCRGADAIGEAAARLNGVPTQIHPADWDLHGKAAGPLRNREMAKEADVVVLLPGGRGTDSMKREAIAAGKTVVEVRITVPPEGSEL